MDKPRVIEVPPDLNEVAIRLALQQPELERMLKALERAQRISRETLEKRCTV